VKIAFGLLLAVALAAFVQGCNSKHGGGGVPVQSFEITPKSGTDLPPATTAAAYTHVFTVLSGGTPPYTFRPITIPPGLTLAPVNGSGNEATLSGTPTMKTPSAVVSFQVVDSTNQKFSNESYTLTVN
jgi:hypothetical protein